MKKQFVSPRTLSQIAIVFAIVVAFLGLSVLQWFYYQPALAHDSAATPSECVALKQTYEAAKTTLSQAQADLKRVKDNTTTTAVASCLTNGILVGIATAVVVGPFAGFGAGVLACAGSVMISIAVHTPGLTTAKRDVRDATRARDDAKNAYFNCMYLHEVYYHSI